MKALPIADLPIGVWVALSGESGNPRFFNRKWAIGNRK